MKQPLAPSDTEKGSDPVCDQIESDPVPLMQQIDLLTREIATLTDDLKRVAADFENYRKRVEREREAMHTQAIRAMAERIIPCIDTFAIALCHSESHEEFVAGMNMIYKQLIGALLKLGVESFGSIGDIFNPTHHQAVENVPSDQPEGTILSVVSLGYRCNGLIIRSAQVTVASRKEIQQHA